MNPDLNYRGGSETFDESQWMQGGRPRDKHTLTNIYGMSRPSLQEPSEWQRLSRWVVLLALAAGLGLYARFLR